MRAENYNTEPIIPWCTNRTTATAIERETWRINKPFVIESRHVSIILIPIEFLPARVVALVLLLFSLKRLQYSVII